MLFGLYMDFLSILNKVIKDFEKAEIRYALIGGFALGLWGVVRATADLDFLVNKESLIQIKNIMSKYGYKCFYESENVSQYDSDNSILGELDFLYAFRAPSLAMLDRAVKKRVFEEKLSLNVLIPEDLIGLKIQAFVNNPKRKLLDGNDIEELIKYNLAIINWDIIHRHFLLFNLEKNYQVLKKKYG